MPCYEPRNRDNGSQEGYERALSELRHNSTLAEMLCEAMQLLEGFGGDVMSIASPNLKQWWKEHQARDKKKKKT